LLDVQTQTQAETDTRTLQTLKPKPKLKTKKTNISTRFGSGRFTVYGLKVPTLTASATARSLAASRRRGPRHRGRVGRWYENKGEHRICISST
jgi:hypothetical protein